MATNELTPKQSRWQNRLEARRARGAVRGTRPARLVLALLLSAYPRTRVSARRFRRIDVLRRVLGV